MTDEPQTYVPVECDRCEGDRVFICGWCSGNGARYHERPGAAICHVADEPMPDLAKDPPGFVAKLIAVEARAEAMRKLAAAYVDSTGADIQAQDGIWFGRRKPASNRKATATLYSKESKNGSSDGN